MNLNTVFPALEGQKKRPEQTGRAARRAAERARTRQQRKAQRNFVRREWAKEREASDLANLFGILDGHVPARLEVQSAAYAAIDARVRHIEDQQEKAGREVEDANVIADRLRELASTARPDMGRRSRIAADKLIQEGI